VSYVCRKLEADPMVKSKKLARAPKTRRRYTLDVLLKQTKRAPRRKTDAAWVAGRPVGRELV
jgi:hypothetical protein